MTNNQKALRGMKTAADLKPKARRRCERRAGYRNRFLAKQERNLAAARLRVIERREEAAKLAAAASKAAAMKDFDAAYGKPLARSNQAGEG